MVQRPQCPGCGKGSPEKWIKVPYSSDGLRTHFTQLGARVDYSVLEGHFFEVVRCNSCQLIYQTDILEDDELGMIYGTAEAGTSPPPRNSEAFATSHRTRS